MKSPEPFSPERAFQDAVTLLAARDYTSARMRAKLAGKGYGEAAVDGAVERLEKEGLLNDRCFAERFADAATAGGRFFGPRLRLEMRRRGVPAGLAEEALERLRVERDELDDLRGIIERRFPGFSPGEATDREKRRLVAFLQRRGFALGTIMRVLKGEGVE